MIPRNVVRGGFWFLLTVAITVAQGAASPSMVADINQRAASSRPHSFTHVGADTFFIASTPGTGAELWIHTRASGRIERLTDISPGPGGSLFPSRISAGPDAVLFIARGRNSANELWISGGTRDRTYQLADIVPDTDELVVSQLTPVADLVYFIARHGSPDWQLWRSDGTAAGTVSILDIPEGTSSEPVILGALDDTLFLGTNGGLFRSDGTRGGTIRIAELRVWSGFRGDWAEAGTDEFYFSGDDGPSGPELWRTDGTREGTRRVKNIGIDGIVMGGSNPLHLTLLGDTLFFLAATGRDSPPMLWSSDGTEEGTAPVADNTNYTPIAATGESLYFVRASRTELWTSDEQGELQHLRTFRQINLGSAIELEGSLVFSADDGSSGEELWVSDGSPDGTSRLGDLNPGPDSSSPGGLTSDGSAVYFSAFDGIDIEPWTSDGTPSGTKRLADIAPGTESSGPSNMAQLDSIVLFAADDGVHARELWRSDGTSEGTTLVSDILLEGGIPPYLGSRAASSPSWLTSINGRVVFSGDAGFSGRELHATDGTHEGTAILVDISRHSYESSNPSDMTRLGDFLLFAIGDNPNFDRRYGRELWRTDGTRSGTNLIRDIEVGLFSSWPSVVATVDEWAIFSASTTTSGRELWITSGEKESTELLVDLTPGEESTPIGSGVGISESVALFSAEVDDAGLELWKTDGTVVGTTLVRDIATGAPSSAPQGYYPYRGGALFVANDPSSGLEVWYSDGSHPGTTLVRDIRPGEQTSAPSGFSELDDIVYFIADDGIHGRELWRTDGTRSGTHMVRDINPGPAGSFPVGMTAFDTQLVFQACSDLGCELWTSDGTDHGTRLAADLNPGDASSSPSSFLVLEDALLFAATNPTHGSELWRLTAADLLGCVGDCDGDGEVSITEIIVIVNQILTPTEPSRCPSITEAPRIQHAVQAVGNALYGCRS